MICFNPDGSYLTKANICSCESCIEGEFLHCTQEKGLYFPSQHLSDNNSDGSSNDDSDDDYSGNQDLCEADEKYELRSNNVLDIVCKDSVIALFSPPNAFELFYLCKVLDFAIAQEPLVDKYNHMIELGCPYIKC